MRRLGFWVMLPYAPKLLEPALERTALHQQNRQPQHEVQEQGKVRHRHGSALDAIESPNPTTTAVWVKREFSTILFTNTLTPLTVVIPAMVGSDMILWERVYATSLMAIVPVIILPLLLQRYVVRGLTFGAVKG